MVIKIDLRVILYTFIWYTHIPQGCIRDTGIHMIQFLECQLNSLAPGKSECHSKNVIFNLVLLIGIFRSSYGNALRWMPQDLTDDKSTLVQVMAWCRQATCHYLSQCWLSSLSPYGVARPQWVNHAAWKLSTLFLAHRCIISFRIGFQNQLVYKNWTNYIRYRCAFV